MLELVLGLASTTLAMLAITIGGYLASAAMCQMTSGGLGHAVSDLVAYFQHNDVDEDEYMRERRARQLVVVMSSSGIVVVVNVVNAAVVAWALLLNGASINIVWWALVITLMAAFQLDTCMKMRGREVDVNRASKMLARINRNVAIFGIAWGTVAIFFIDDLHTTTSLIVIMALIGTAAGGLALLAVLPPAALIFVTALGGPVLYKFLASGDPAAGYLAVFSCVYTFALGAITAGVYGAVIKRPALNALGRSEECSGIACTDFKGRRIA
ncbi:MAG: hypothetical protein KDA46_09745 [Parvularculaceae bacterium]|nr:hypothetical protein [Parvularculaceae bacterium]